METMKLKNERKKKEISEKKEVGEVITIARRNLVGEKLKLVKTKPDNFVQRELYPW